jgi:hypothetical protein
MVTLRGRFAHGQYLAAASTCVDDAVTSYLLGGALPPRNLECTATAGR